MMSTLFRGLHPYQVCGNSGRIAQHERFLDARCFIKMHLPMNMCEGDYRRRRLCSKKVGTILPGYKKMNA